MPAAEHMQVVLASVSPRRSELLASRGVSFRVVASPAEELHDATLRPEDLCETNARLKARAVAAGEAEAVVIGADTLVFIDGVPLGKPRDMDDARAMLRKLSGRVHHVCTGVCMVFPDGREAVFHEITRVAFRELGEEDISAYFRVANPLDKAGAYGIQECGEMLIASVEGCRDNVMGLPVDRVVDRLKRDNGP